MVSHDELACINRQSFERPENVIRYVGGELQAAELRLLNEFKHRLSGGSVLDVGCGGGRLVPYLVPVVSRYVGIDYSLCAIMRCRQLFPDLEFRVADMRDLSILPDTRFDAVIIAYNSIDYVSHADRCRILLQIRSRLTDDGLLIFSSHNLEHLNKGEPKRWWNGYDVADARAALKIFRRASRQLYASLRYQKVLSGNRGTHVIDGAHKSELITYYISVTDQFRQLRDCGYEPLRLYSHAGVGFQCDSEMRDLGPWIYYAAEPKEKG